MKSRWVKRMMLSYLPLFFIVVSVLVFIFFLAVNQVAEKENKRANQQFAGHILQTIDNEMYALEQAMLRDVYFSEAVQKFFNPLYVGDSELNYEVFQSLQEFVASQQLADSVYLLRELDQSVMSDTIMVSAASFMDTAYVMEQRDRADAPRWSNARMYKEVSSSLQRQVISNVRPYPLAGQQKGWVVLNLSTSGLQSLISTIGRVELSHIAVHDRAGEWILGNMPRLEFSPGSMDFSLDSEMTGLRLSAGLNTHYLFNSFRLISGIWIVSGLLIIALGCAWLLYLIRRNYEPIEALTARVEQYTLRKSMQLRGRADEFQFIEHALDDLLLEAQSHTRQLAESRGLQDKLHFQEIVESVQGMERSQLDELLSRKGFAVAAGGWRVALVEIDGYAEFSRSFTRKDQHLLKFALSSVIRELAAGHKLHIWTEWVSDSRIGCMIQQSEEAGPAALGRYYDEMLAWVRAHLSFTVTIAEGERVDNPEHLYISTDAAAELLQLKATLGTNRRIHGEDADRSPEYGYYHLLPSIHELAESFKLGKPVWEAQFGALLDTIEGHRMARRHIVNAAEYLLHKLGAELEELQPPGRPFWNDQVKERLTSAISRFDTAGDLFRHFKLELHELFNLIASWRAESSHKALVEKAQAHILDNLTDDNLSLSSVSARFEMTQTQFSLAFKQSVGEKFVDYVMRMRIELAKQLLVETDLPVQEIGVRVGYQHAVSFNRAFKRCEGITPTEYRRDRHAG